MIEMPDPFRSDWRFAYLTATIINTLGGRKTPVTVRELFDDMRGFFCVLPEEVDEGKIKSNLMAFMAVNNQQKKPKK